MSEPKNKIQLHTVTFFPGNLLVIKMKKQICMNKAVYIGLSILEISKIVIYEFWYDYVKSKYGERAKLCYMDTDSFILYIKTKNDNKKLKHCL